MDAAHDIVVIGGGLVGGSVACALALAGRDVALVEASDPQRAAPPGFDDRNLALAAASLEALGRLGVLAHLATPPAPIRRIHVSRSGDFGSVGLDAADYGHDAFGGVVVARELGAALEARIDALPRIRRYRPARFLALDAAPAAIGIELALASGEASSAVRAKLLLACDGSDSAVRLAHGVEVDRHDYGQTLIVSALQADRAHAGNAWERFTDSGPLALLPRADGAYGCVCGVPGVEAAERLAMPDDAWRDWLQQRFGFRAGRFLRVGRRSAYPIVRGVARALVAPRTAILGNAAQTIHPIGAQGFNLGLRDALDLAALVQGADDPGAADLLAAYPARRAADRGRILGFSDGLARLTSTEGVAHHLLRSAGLVALGQLAALRAPLVRAAMGYRDLDAGAAA